MFLSFTTFTHLHEIILVKKHKSKELLEKPNQNQRFFSTQPSRALIFTGFRTSAASLFKASPNLSASFWEVGSQDTWTQVGWLQLSWRWRWRWLLHLRVVSPFFFGGGQGLQVVMLGTCKDRHVLKRSFSETGSYASVKDAPEIPSSSTDSRTFTLITGSGKSIFSKTIGASTAHKVSPWTTVTRENVAGDFDLGVVIGIKQYPLDSLCMRLKSTYIFSKTN